MTIKYVLFSIYILSGSRLRFFMSLYSVYHVPIVGVAKFQERKHMYSSNLSLFSMLDSGR